MLRTGYLLGQWKLSQIIPLLKPGKPAAKVTSYIPISLLPFLSKLFEKLSFTRIQPILHDKRVIPDRQFGFRRQHATIEQLHRVTNVIQYIPQYRQISIVRQLSQTLVRSSIRCGMKDSCTNCKYFLQAVYTKSPIHTSQTLSNKI
jgi:hypothetical protein